MTIKGFRNFVGDAFVNSVIASSKIDRVKIQSVQTDNVSTWFGLLASADDGQRIKSVVTSVPDHKWVPLLLDDDFVGDFHVQMITNPD